jgi:hypothetical protein
MVAFLLVGALGCGSGTPASPVTAAAGSGLNGNWLITGTLPFIDPLNFGNKAFGITMTFASTGNQITAGGTENVPCGNFIVGGGTVLAGTLAADGTVSMQSTLGAPVPSLALTGKGPAAGASSWTGTYTYTSTNTSCPQTLTGPFTATRIADVTGTYAPAAPVQLMPASLGATPQPVTLTFSFVQGAMLPGTNQFDPELLSGSVQIQGSTCFKSGATASLLGSGLLGSNFVTSFALNDGSIMNFLGDIEDTGSTRLVVQGLFVSGGSCGTLSAQPFEVVKQ